MEFAREHHLYQTDLDILGEGSLFELLSTTRSEVGAERLSSFLLDPTTVHNARERQDAVKELRDATVCAKRLRSSANISFTPVTWSIFASGSTSPFSGCLARFKSSCSSPAQLAYCSIKAVGPGGTYTSDAAVNVNTDITASLNVTPADVNLQNTGQGSGTARTAMVSWSAPNATSVTVDPIGSVGASGSQEVPVKPSGTATGPIDQTVTYTLHATNACGGDQTRTATLHITGSTAPPEAAANEPPAPQAEPPAKPTEIAQAAPAELPHTASPLPLVALIGSLFLMAAAGLRMILKMMSA